MKDRQSMPRHDSKLHLPNGSVINSVKVIVVSLVIACCGTGCSNRNQTTLEVVEQDVIEAVLADNADTPAVGKRGLYNRSSTRFFWGGEDTFASFVEALRREASHEDALLQELVENYVQVNAADSALLFPRKLPDNIILVPPNRNVEALKDRFGSIDGVYEISRVGTDGKHTAALVSVAFYKGLNAAWGRFYILRFDGKKWIVQKMESFGPRPMT